jgi:4-amino-4-deoxy-L-arabinose transferase-like glycosyltransferase
MVEGVRGSLDRRDVFAVAILGLIGIGVPLWLAAAAGAIGLPAIDDWVYTRGAGSLFRMGGVDMPGHTAAAIGQLAMVQALLWVSGGNPWAFTAFGLVMTLIGVVATYLLARRFVGTGSAVMVVLLVEAFPGFARESASFMTDVPAYALAMLCLLLGTRWLEGGRRLTLAASLGVGLLAVSVREFAIAAPVAVLVVAWARSRADERAWLVGMSGAFVAGVAGVLIVAASIPGRGVAPMQGGLGELILVGPAFTTFAAVLLPAIVLGLGRRWASFRPEPLILGAGLVGLVLVMPYGSLVGSLWMTNGAIGNALLSGTRDLVIGAPA